MALLSNINDKFAVDSTGAIQFNGSHGTAGQVLKSNGNAAPTWVDASTVIGGPYLPLSGGTLTGATATASGISFTVGGALTTQSLLANSFMEIRSDAASLYFENAANNNYYRLKRSSNDFVIDYYNGTTTSDRLTINSSGKVGIGTTTMNTTLNLYSASNTQIGFQDASTGTGSADGFRVGYNGTYGQMWLFENAAMRFATNNTERMRITSGGNVGIGTTSPAAKLQSVQTTSGEWTGGFKNYTSNGYGLRVDMSGSSSVQAALQVYTGSGTGFVVKNSGVVGIGTFTPGAKLEISGIRENQIRLTSYDTTAAVDEIIGGVEFYTSDISAPRVSSFITSKFNSAFGDSYLSFGTSTGVGAATERMRITNNGNIVIGGGSAYSGTGVTSLTVNNNSYPTLALGTLSANRFAILAYSSYNLFASSNNFVFNSGNILVGKTVDDDNTNGCRLSNNGLISGTRSGNVSGIFGRNDSVGNLVLFRQDSTQVGRIVVTASTTSYVTSSDYRLKENVVELTGALDRVSQLKPSRFNFIADADKTVDGFLAHEVQDIVPEAISGEKDAVDEEGNPEYQGIDQSKLVPLLVGAIKELEARVKELENK